MEIPFIYISSVKMNISQFIGLFTRKKACAFKILECSLADQLNI